MVRKILDGRRSDASYAGQPIHAAADRASAAQGHRTFRLTPGKVEAAQRILGAPTATEAIETALDMPEAKTHLVRFHTLFAPFEYLSAVVLQELRAGVTSAADLERLERHVLDPFVRRGRLVTPSFRVWERSGDVLRELARQDGLDLRTVSKALGNEPV